MAVALAVLSARAQQRIPCDRSAATAEGRAMTRATRAISALTGQHRVPIILATFSDQGFQLSDEETHARWEAMLNQHGYAENGANGCLSDYFKAQSQGLLELTFDVLGPVVLPQPVAYYGKNRNGTEGDDTNPQAMIRDACVATGQDFSPYDWNGDGFIDAVVVVFAGQGENRGGGADAIWPHKYTATSYKVGDLTLNDYACASDERDGKHLDGYGTVCHEFSHCLGLPDLYPVSGSEYSIFDEWDLMDGGNYANHGYGIPNYSAFERQLCGWLKPTTLTGPTTISDLPPMDEEAGAYVIFNDGHPQEYFILENRQQRGWDSYVPGNGLIVTHVCDYTIGNLSPNTSSQTRVALLSADNRTYRQSEAFFGDSKYTADGHNRYLSLAAYPYGTEGNVISNSSTPAFTLKKENTDATLYLSKPVSNIQMDSEGHISFDFMMMPDPIPTAISDARAIPAPAIEGYYDLRGRRLPSRPQAPGIYIIRYADGKTKKTII